MSNKQEYNSGWIKFLKTSLKQDHKRYLFVLNLNKEGTTALYYDAMSKTLKVLDTKYVQGNEPVKSVSLTLL